VQIRKISPPKQLPNVRFEIACDVTNQLFGAGGAAHIFSPQKGANAQQVDILDNGLKNLAKIIEEQTGKKVATIPGSGAAGGIAAGLMAFFPVMMMKGTQVVVEASNIERVLNQADVIITGEGKLDLQSFHGKTISAISYLGRQYQIPVVALCGKVELTDSEWIQLGLSFACEIKDQSMSEEVSMKNAYSLLVRKSELLLPVINKIITV
jgi:glycerate kinase